MSKIEKDKYISFHWDMDDNELMVEMILDKYDGDNTVLTISEKSSKKRYGSISWLTGNTKGKANFLAGLKAYLTTVSPSEKELLILRNRSRITASVS